MAKIRVHKTTNFVVMSNTHLRNKQMSLKAKGLLSQMLALPDEWQYSIKGLASINKESEETIKTILNELKKFNYLVISRKFPNETKTGRIEYIYDIYEEPYTEKQQGKKQGVVFQEVEKQGVVFSAQLNKENKIYKNKIYKNKKTSKRTYTSEQIENWYAG